MDKPSTSTNDTDVGPAQNWKLDKLLQNWIKKLQMKKEKKFE